MGLTRLEDYAVIFVCPDGRVAYVYTNKSTRKYAGINPDIIAKSAAAVCGSRELKPRRVVAMPTREFNERYVLVEEAGELRLEARQAAGQAGAAAVGQESTAAVAGRAGEAGEQA